MAEAHDKAQQKTSFWTDLSRRPRAYLTDLGQSPALKFAGGNLLYAGFLVLQTGVNAGSAAAGIFQGVLTGISGKKQMEATYKGEGFDAPYKVQGWGNIITSVFIAATSFATYAQERAEEKNQEVNPVIAVMASNTDKQDDVWTRMVFPSFTFMAWGLGHFAFGAAARRRKELQKAGLSDEAISLDPELKKSIARGEVEAGVADVTAIFKDKSLAETGKMLEQPFQLQNLNSLVGFPFFIIGFYKSVVRGNTPLIGEHLNLLQTKAIESLPDSLRSAMHLERQSITPVHYYAAGYGATAVVSAAAAVTDPVQLAFAAASGSWSWGYHDLTREGTPVPQSADQYAALHGFSLEDRAGPA